MKKIYILFSLLLWGLGGYYSLSAQSLALQLQEQLDCNSESYCVTIQVKRDSGTSKLRLGTSSIWLDYNATALQFQSYQANQFHDGIVCDPNVNVINYAPHSYDAISEEGVFHLVLSLLSTKKMCPKLDGSNWVDIGTICFDILQQGGNPDISIDLHNTHFNKHNPNNGSVAFPVTTSDSLCQAGALACSCPGPSLPCDDQNVYTVNDRFDAYCECNGDLQDSDGDGIYDGVDPCLDVKYEAEDATLVGGPHVDDNYPQFSGLGFVDFVGGVGQSMSFEITATDTGVHDFAVRYASGSSSNRPLSVDLDSSQLIASLDFQFTGGWDVWDTVYFSANLSVGTHQITFTSLTNGGAGNLDFLMVSECTSCTQSGQACDDQDPCTVGDIFDAHCNCAGVAQDSDKDGVCDQSDICPGGNDLADIDNDGTPDACDTCNNLLVGTACDDGDPCTARDVYDANCNCAGIFRGNDSDNDGVCDAQDQCPGGDDLADIDGDGTPDFCDSCNDLNIGKPCSDGNPCTILDRFDAQCNCVGIPMDDDNDNVCNWEDQCPNFDNSLIGTRCDDGDPNTVNDVYTSYCSCAGEAPVLCNATGELKYEFWNNILYSTFSRLSTASHFPSTPDSTAVITTGFSGKYNDGDNYADRISGILCPPQTGYYTFMVSGDDYTELYLSSDETRENSGLIAYIHGWTSVNEWTKYPSQRSDSVVGSIYLIKGKSYFMECLHKEGGGGDHFSVRWIRPDGSDEAPLPAQYFSLPKVQLSFKHEDISCHGLTDGLAIGVPSHGVPPYSFQWSNGVFNDTILGLSQGVYSLTVTDALGNSITRSVEINEPAPLSATHTQVDVTCFGGNDGSISLVPIGGTGRIYHSWGGGLGTDSTISGLIAKKYTAYIRDSENCRLNYDIYITQPDEITINTEIVPSTGSDGQIHVVANQGVAPYSYNWSDGATGTNRFGLAPNTYVLVVTDANGCLKSENIIVANPPKMETGYIAAISDSWQRLTFEKSYTSPVIVATVSMDTTSMPPAVTRIRNITGNSCEIRIQGTNGKTHLDYRVHYMVVEEGTYNEAHGIRMEAVRAPSVETASNNNWVMESRTFLNDYKEPVVVGQVMTENDTSWSVFWASRNNSISVPPKHNNFAAGKHVGEDPDSTRANETIGYIAFEEGQHQIGSIFFEAKVGSNSIRGVRDRRSGIAYPVAVNRPIGAVLSSAGMNGTDGGWPVLVGEQPIGAAEITLGIDEYEITDRSHGNEEVAYVAFATDCPVATGRFPAMEHGSISDVTASWQLVQLCHDYTSPVIIATPILESNTSISAVTRIQNVRSNSFELMVQNPSGFTGKGIEVQYWVVEEGVYTQEANGIQLEAVRVSTQRVSSKRDWESEPRNFQQNYNQPVVVGQVMSHNDSAWSVFWASRNSSRTRPPEMNNLAAGAHVAEDPNVIRSSETIGYIIVEAGVYTNNGYAFEAGLGADIVKGLDNSTTGYAYPLAIQGAYGAVASSAAMDGTDGGWPALLGANAISSSQLLLAIQEDQLDGKERSHTTEQLAYVAFGTGITTGARFATYTLESDDVDEENLLFDSYSIFPNPTANHITIEWSQDHSDEASITVFDIMGRQVQHLNYVPTLAGLQRQNLSMAHLPNGTYLVILNTQGYQLEKKVIKVNE